MKGVAAVMKRELRSYFNSPIAYIVTLCFLLFCAVWFFFKEQFFAAGKADLRAYFSIMPWVFVFLVPSLTMRSWSEEFRQGTAELLLTLPWTEAKAVIGKYLASLVLLGFILVLTVTVPLSVSALGDFDGGQVLGEYLGILLLGSASLALGQYVSSRTRNQITAFILTAVALLFLILIKEFLFYSELTGWFASLLGWISVTTHFESFIKGLVDTRDLAYFALITFAFLFLTAWGLRMRKWS